MRRAASSECGGPCVGGSGSPAMAGYDAALTPPETGSEKCEPRCVTQFRNELSYLNLTVVEWSFASNCTRRCTAPSVTRSIGSIGLTGRFGRERIVFLQLLVDLPSKLWRQVHGRAVLRGLLEHRPLPFQPLHCY